MTAKTYNTSHALLSRGEFVVNGCKSRQKTLSPVMNVDQVLPGDTRGSALSGQGWGRRCHYSGVWSKLKCAPNYRVSHRVMVLNTIQIHVLPVHDEVSLNLTFDWILNAINYPFILCDVAPWIAHDFLLRIQTASVTSGSHSLGIPDNVSVFLSVTY